AASSIAGEFSPPAPLGLPAAATCAIFQASSMALPLPSHLAATQTAVPAREGVRGTIDLERSHSVKGGTMNCKALAFGVALILPTASLVTIAQPRAASAGGETRAVGTLTTTFANPDVAPPPESGQPRHPVSILAEHV